MPTVPDGERAAEQYDAMAAEYSSDNDEGVFNSLYERPAILSMLGDVKGLRVLDIGCGAGQLTRELVERGAVVTGIDVSPAMVEIARNRLGGLATFTIGALSEPLPFESGSFDVVVASLVMHYIEEWTPVLKEILRVLTPDGSLALSTHHPTMDWRVHSRADYFAKKQSTETWVKGGRPFEVTTWRRPLSEISREIREAGFAIDVLAEPMPVDSLAEIDPSKDEYLRTRAHFLFIRAIPRRPA